MSTSTNYCLYANIGTNHQHGGCSKQIIFVPVLQHETLDLSSHYLKPEIWRHKDNDWGGAALLTFHHYLSVVIRVQKIIVTIMICGLFVVP